MKWTAFDQETAATLSKHLSDVELSKNAADAIDAAVEGAANGHVALVAPASDGDASLLVTFRTKDTAATEPSGSAEPVGYQAGGFLGLSDEPLYEDRERR